MVQMITLNHLCLICASLRVFWRVETESAAGCSRIEGA